jgi:hypothetical protein
MSQETNASTATLPLQETTPVDAAELVNTYADTLISSLFEDVDKLLDGDEAAIETATRELETGDDDAELLAAAASTAAAESTDLAATETDDDSPVAPSTELGLYQNQEAGNETTQQPEKTTLGRLFDRFLLATTACSLLGVVAFAWVSWQRDGNWAFFSQAPTAQTEGLSQSNAEFLSYLNRSLNVIVQETDRLETATATTQGGTVSVTPVPPVALPPLANNPGISNGLGRPQLNVIERVYIPYQTTPQPATQPQQPVAAVPSPQAPAPVPQTPAVAPAAPTPAPVHVLVGVLELGERSAALFEIDGVPQRVYMGERIGSSGWSLVSVSNEEAVVRRNGEVRSLFIGQQF